MALNRPSYQISTFSYNGQFFYAAYANDGNHGTHLWSSPCAHTSSETNPWWAVDLLVPLYVAGVNFTNRDEWSTCDSAYIMQANETTVSRVFVLRKVVTVSLYLIVIDRSFQSIFIQSIFIYIRQPEPIVAL